MTGEIILGEGGISYIIDVAAEFGIALLEGLGIITVIAGTLVGTYHLIKYRSISRTRLEMAKVFAMALEFKMGGEILRSVIVRSWAEISILGAIIILRGILNFIIMRELAESGKHQK